MKTKVSSPLEEIAFIKNGKFSYLKKFELTDFVPENITNNSFTFSTAGAPTSKKPCCYYTLLPASSKSCLISSQGLAHHQRDAQVYENDLAIACHVPAFQLKVEKYSYNYSKKKHNIKVPNLLWVQSLNLLRGGDRFKILQLQKNKKTIVTRPLGVGNAFETGICWGHNQKPISIKSAHNLYWSSPFTSDHAWGNFKEFNKSQGRWVEFDLKTGLLCKSHLDAVLVLVNSPYTTLQASKVTSEIVGGNWLRNTVKQNIAIAFGKYIDDSYKFVIPANNGIGYCFQLKTLSKGK